MKAVRTTGSESTNGKKAAGVRPSQWRDAEQLRRRRMTETEIEIVKAEYEHHEKLSAEITSHKSFSGALASIAGFIVLEWMRASPKPHGTFVVLAVLPLVLSAYYFFRLCISDRTKFASESEKWMDWKRERSKTLITGDYPDTSEDELRDSYYRQLCTTIQINRSQIINRQVVSERAGFLAMSSIAIVLIHTTSRFIFS
jgi:hypothetical protein